MTSPPSSSPYQSVSTRLRAESAGSQASLQSTDSLASSVSEVASKRHEEFQRYFGARLLDENPGVPAEELLTVVATQSGDLQAKLLLHGRVYLTRHHLCFRCNILGYKRETIHPLTGIRSVKRGTTAKWIQNAVYVIEDGHELGDYTGYGSMADRDAMYESILECWKMAAPERYTDWMDRGSEDELIPSKSVEEEEGEDEPVATTQCSGEDHLGEVALDTVVGMPLDKLYRLVYHDREFIEAFYTRDKGLTDLKISEWETKNGHERRTLTYVMHMNNSIGPSESDCDGSETIVVTDPSKCYEIVSETQTPGVPSGSKFKIHTRTCLTAANVKGNPATRMYCTTQCDWSSGSWLKSTITPAVIKGQKEHHKMLLKKIKRYMVEHPEQYEAIEDEETAGVAAIEEIGSKSYWDHALDIPDNPVMITILVVLVLALVLAWCA